MVAQTFLVGGAVRDELLGLPVKDRDWVVVGASVDAMLDAGYQQVGRDFPVFLHPQTHEEYALARTERKQGRGHTGFVVHADVSVTLEQDLKRRDLTINAIAKDLQGKLIDPYGGRQDLSDKVLRHVSPAFVEDPLRVLRVARFAAQLPQFEIAPETMALMSEVVTSGELATLSRERVWSETERVLGLSTYARFFTVLDACGALPVWFDELNRVSLPTRPALTAQAGYARLPLSPEQFASLSQRLGVPRDVAQLAMDRVQHATVLMHWADPNTERLCDTFEQLKVPHGLQRLATVIEILSDLPAKDGLTLMSLAEGFAKVKLPATSELSGPAYGQALYQARLEWLRAAVAEAVKRGPVQT